MTTPEADQINWFRIYFRPHFDEWIIGPIDRLVKSQDALIGFIFMSCAIDYLAGFLWGKSTIRENRKAYINFIDDYFEKNKYDANGLYDSLRNGLVHMFTIKNKKYGLIHNNPQLHLYNDPKGPIILNASNFRDDFVLAKNKYFTDVETRPHLMEKFLERYKRDGFLDVSTINVK